MGHFALSMLILLAAVVLAWRASHEPSARHRARRDGAPARDAAPATARSSGRCARWSALGALTIFAGTAATAAGPHAGGSPGQKINRLSFDGRGDDGLRDPPPRRDRARVQPRGGRRLVAGAPARGARPARAAGADGPVRAAGPQGAVGLDQYETHLPTELVWVHVGLACGVWLAALWAALRRRPRWRPRRRPSERRRAARQRGASLQRPRRSRSEFPGN